MNLREEESKSMPSTTSFVEELKANAIFKRFLRIGVAEDRIMKLCVDGLEEQRKLSLAEPNDDLLLVQSIKKANREQKATQSYEENMQQMVESELARNPSSRSLAGSVSMASFYAPTP